MQVQELRIGNYVKSILGLIDTFMIYKSDLHTMTEEGRDLSIYEPIPLTEEWLLKFGFEKEDKTIHNGNYYSKGEMAGK